MAEEQQNNLVDEEVKLDATKAEEPEVDAQQAAAIPDGEEMKTKGDVPIADVIEVDYADLVAGKDLTAEVEQAYGAGGLGVLIVSNVPKYDEFRERLLMLARDLGALPEEELAPVSQPSTDYFFGWSRGKEYVDGGVDIYKGSYCANPQMDVPTTDEDMVTKYPHFCAPNLWVREEALPGFQQAYKELGCLMVEVGKLVTRQCDRYAAARLPGYEAGILERLVTESHAHKGRLLHYFPTKGAEKKRWCGWHTDFGLITGLTRAIFRRDADGRVVANPDPKSGLRIRRDNGEVLKLSVRPDQMVFQAAETMQVLTAGLLRATWHGVTGPREGLEAAHETTRSTFAMFMQPDMLVPLEVPPGSQPSDVAIPFYEPGHTFYQYWRSRVGGGYTDTGTIWF